MNHDWKNSVLKLVEYCQEAYAENPAQLMFINEFSRGYDPNQAIWWYTRESFIYQTLNCARRLLEGNMIVNMGFFIRDLHQQIQELHKGQLGKYDGQPFLFIKDKNCSTTISRNGTKCRRADVFQLLPFD